MIYVINYFQAGANGKGGSSYSNGMGWMSFEEKVDFSVVRKTLKEMVLMSIEDNNPCMPELITFYTIIRIKNDKVAGRYRGNVKSLDILKWKTK